MTFHSSKTALSILDFSVDWSTYLGSDSILSSTWILPDDLTEVSNTFEENLATVFVSGGVSGKSYSLVNVMYYSDGRCDTATIVITVE